MVGEYYFEGHIYPIFRLYLSSNVSNKYNINQTTTTKKNRI